MFYNVCAVQQNESAVHIYMYTYVYLCICVHIYILSFGFENDVYFLKNYLFIFVYPGSSLLGGFLSGCREQGLLSIAVCSGLSCCRAWALGCTGFSSGSVVAAARLECRLSSCATGA